MYADPLLVKFFVKFVTLKKKKKTSNIFITTNYKAQLLIQLAITKKGCVDVELSAQLHAK